MLFNSWTYALFLPVTVAVFYMAGARWRHWVLLVASYIFYGWWDARFLSLIVLSTVVDFWAARRLHAEKETGPRRRWVLLSLSVNLGILGFFKYWNFFIDSTIDALSAVGLQPNPPLLRVILPVGISFYTFQTLSYTIDVYRGKLRPERSLPRFALFVAFFPQLVAGPIERATRLLPQLKEIGSARIAPHLGPAAALIARGLFRKLAIADGVAPIVNEVFADPTQYNALSVLMSVVAFSLQIYGDFAGYTDIARGTAKLFGVDLMVNFRAPYTARSFRDFWRRWHISLSTWLRDYLYIPLGGSRGSDFATARNLMITMTLGGLWHGAGWGFVIWGVLHGAYLVLERFTGLAAGRGMPSGLVFALVSLTWIPFRADSFTVAMEVFQGLTRFSSGAQLVFAPLTLAILGLASIWLDQADLEDRVDPLARYGSVARGAGYATAVTILILAAAGTEVPFIYFQF